MRPLHHLSLLAIFLSCAMLPCPLIASEELRVEGIIEDKNPEETIAVVNGILIKKGDTVQNYTVKEIQKTKVVFTDGAGKETSVSLLATKKSSPSTTGKEISKTDPVKTEASEAAQKKTKEDLEKNLSLPQNALASLPSGFMEKLTALPVIMDMKNLRMVVASQYAESMEIPTVDQLVQRGVLNPAFEKGGVKGNYIYSIAAGANGDPVIYADPTPDHENLPHYMQDEWGNIRVAKGEKANSKSPIYNGMMG